MTYESKKFSKDHAGCYDFAEVVKTAEWYRKKYSDQPGITSLYCDDGEVCVYIFRGSYKTLVAIDRFLSVYRKFRSLFWRE